MKHIRKHSSFVIAAGLLLVNLSVACTEEPLPEESDDDEGSSTETGSSMGTGGNINPGAGPGGNGGAGGSGGSGDLDQACAQGASAFCVCLEAAGEPACTQSELEDFYGFCASGQDNGYLSCFGSYVQNEQISCEAAVNGCSYLLPEG